MAIALLKNINKIDPLTREELKPYVIINNISVKKAVDWYSETYPEVAFRSDNKSIEI